jgi:hypothetical protein
MDAIQITGSLVIFITQKRIFEIFYSNRVQAENND